MLATARSEDLRLRAACEEVWERLSQGTRRTFFWDAPGGTFQAPVCHPVCNLGEAADVSTPDSGLQEAHFAVIIMVPDAVDELRLGGNQKRYKYTLNSVAQSEADCPATLDTAAAAADAAKCSLVKLLAPDRTEWIKQEVNP